MSQTHKVRGVETAVVKDGDNLTVVYRGTAVVEKRGGTIRLNTGGWFTATTRTRMMQAANEFGLGYSVYQKARKWFVDWKGETIPFDNETMVLS
jgi:hypothetical protein